MSSIFKKNNTLPLNPNAIKETILPLNKNSTLQQKFLFCIINCCRHVYFFYFFFLFNFFG